MLFEVLSEGAQCFCDMFNSYVEYVNKKYASESESDGEDNCDGICPGKDSVMDLGLLYYLFINTVLK